MLGLQDSSFLIYASCKSQEEIQRSVLITNVINHYQWQSWQMLATKVVTKEYRYSCTLPFIFFQFW